MDFQGQSLSGQGMDRLQTLNRLRQKWDKPRTWDVRKKVLVVGWGFVKCFEIESMACQFILYVSISLSLWIPNSKVRLFLLSSQEAASLHINNGKSKRRINKPNWLFPLRIQIPWLDQQDLEDCGLLNLMQLYKPIIQTICDVRIQMDGQGLQARQLRRENLATSIPTRTTGIRKTELQSAYQAHAMW